MEVGAVVTADTIGDAWRAGLSYFSDPARLYRHESERGVTFDLPCLTLVSSIPSPVPVPPEYPYPEIVDEYMGWMFGSSQDHSMLAKRLYRWSGKADYPLNQVVRIKEMLARQPETRSAVYSLWSPEVDLDSAYSVSPVAGTFRVIDKQLHQYVVGRSADYWVGAIPDMLILARLQCEMAKDLNYEVGSLVFHMWSAHIYEDEYLANVWQPG